MTLLVGLLLATLGSGGSILMLPILVYAAGIEPRAAVPMSMVIVGLTSFAAAILHARRGNFHLKGMLLLGSSGMAGSLIGARGIRLLPPHTLMLIFSGILLVVGALILRGRESDLHPAVCRPARCLGAGLFIGLLTGLLGVGGGFLIVPTLVLLAGIEPAAAVGTSLGIITLNTAAGLLGHLGAASFSPVLDWRQSLWFAALALAGMTAGLRATRHLPARTMSQAFATLLLLMGAVIGIINLR